jgi:hypothetical protein
MYEYIGILLGARPILHISRIKVNVKFNVSLCIYLASSGYVIFPVYPRKCHNNFITCTFSVYIEDKRERHVACTEETGIIEAIKTTKTTKPYTGHHTEDNMI